MVIDKYKLQKVYKSNNARYTDRIENLTILF